MFCFVGAFIDTNSEHAQCKIDLISFNTGPGTWKVGDNYSEKDQKKFLFVNSKPLKDLFAYNEVHYNEMLLAERGALFGSNLVSSFAPLTNPPGCLQRTVAQCKWQILIVLLWTRIFPFSTVSFFSSSQQISVAPD